MGKVAIMVAPIFSMAVLVASILSAEATTYTVGGDSGWTKPADSSFYSKWASGIAFHVNDILVFEFKEGNHDVAQVSEEAYTNCDASSTTITTSPPISVTLTDSSYYFICTIGGGSHCSAGQKLAVTLSTNSSATTPTTPSPPPSNSASSPLTPVAASAVFGLLYVAAFFI